jgi:hypothetical protein
VTSAMVRGTGAGALRARESSVPALSADAAAPSLSARPAVLQPTAGVPMPGGQSAV